MRFVHKKISKRSAFSHILSDSPSRGHVFALPDRQLIRRQGLFGDYNKPANLRHYLNQLGASSGAKASQPGSHAERLSSPYRRHAFSD